MKIWIEILLLSDLLKKSSLTYKSSVCTSLENSNNSSSSEYEDSKTEI